jgi:hypothetical protein
MIDMRQYGIGAVLGAYTGNTDGRKLKLLMIFKEALDVILVFAWA